MKLSDILRGSAPALSSARPADARKLETAIKRVDQTFLDIAPTPSEQDRESVARAFQRRIEAWNWEGCTVENTASAARAAFALELRDLKDLEKLRGFMLAEAKASDHGGVLKAMLDVHVDSYEQGAERTRMLAAAMKARRAHLPVRSQEMLAILPEALDAVKGGTVLGRRMATAADAAAPFAGLPVIPAGGLVDTASAGFVATLAPRMAEEPVARRVLDWFAPDGGRARAVGAEGAIDALLSPWRGGEPPAAWKQVLLDRLVVAYGDPRLPKSISSAAWDRVGTLSRETFIRWQTGETLEAFLNIISIVNEEEEVAGRHMWPARRRFWQKMHEQKHIEAAWVAFNRNAAKKAVELSRSSGDQTLRNFGRQIAGGGRADTSILILRVNGCTVVEGSHSYKVHVFPQGHRKIPELFKLRYDCEEIRLSLPDESQKRVHDASGRWMDWVREKTGCPR